MSQTNGCEAAVKPVRCPVCDAFWRDRFEKQMSAYQLVGWWAFGAAAFGLAVGYSLGVQVWRFMPWGQ